MPPVVLFDKSFLESLNENSSVWFDHHFSANICPIFWIETLSNLASVKPGITPEQRVRKIASKFPERHGFLNAHHLRLCIQELKGRRYPFDGSIPLPVGKQLRVGDQSGARLEMPPEIQALLRWQRGKYSELERDYAKGWRDNLSLLANLDDERFLRDVGVSPTRAKSLAEAKDIADSFVKGEELSSVAERVIRHLLVADDPLVTKVVGQWRKARATSLTKNAPYLAHVATVEMFSRIAINSKLISAVDPGERIDLAYLFYVPFCHAFASGDGVHERCAKLFLRANQRFSWGITFCKELRALDVLRSNDKDKINASGVDAMPARPLNVKSGEVTAIWDVALPDWREGPATFSDAAMASSNLARHLGVEGKAAGPAERTPRIVDVGDVDQIMTPRMIRKRKGIWVQTTKGN